MGTNWWPEETNRAGSEHLDPDYVALFDQKSPTDWSETVEALSQLGVGATSSVVDFGAGTGTFALAVRPLVRRVIAVDASPAMVALMRARGVEAVEAGFLSYHHNGGLVDLVHSRNALHHLPDFWKAVALQRVAEILRPGGFLILEDIVYSFAVSDTDRTIEDWLEHATADPAVGWTAEELAEHVRTEHSTFSWLLEPILDQTGFDITDRWHSASRIYASYTCKLRKRGLRADRTATSRSAPSRSRSSPM
jgi:SAM-dependent methyltransferase